MIPHVTLTQIAEHLGACTLEGTLFLMLVGLLALGSGSASRRHFVWICGLAGLIALLLLDPVLPQLELLPAWLSVTEWAGTQAAWITILWGAGAGLLLTRIGMGLLALRRLRRHSTLLNHPDWCQRLAHCQQSIGVRKRVHLLQYPGWIMPMTWGLLRSFIVVPSTSLSWSLPRTRTVLMHELAHIRRRDFATTIFRDLVCALFWFHPLVWWIAREMDEDREEACDDVVLAAGETPARYAGHLASVATHGQFSPSNAPRPQVALARKPLRTRVGSILSPWKSRHPMRWLDRLQVILAVALLFLVTASIDFQTAEARGVEGHAPLSGHSTKQLPESGLPAFDARSLAALSVPAEVRSSWRAEASSLADLVFPAKDEAAEASGWKHLEGRPLVDEQRPSAAPRVTAGVVIGAIGGSEAIVPASAERSPLNGGVVEMPDYSTSPPNEGDVDPREMEEDVEGGGAGLQGDLLPNLLNVDIWGVIGDGGAGGIPGDGKNTPNDFFAPLGVGVSNPQPLPGTTKLTETGFVPHWSERLESLKRVETVQQPDSSKLPGDRINRVVTGQGQRGMDPGVIADGHLVKNLKTGGRHLAITFRRKPNSQTALYRVEASKDLVHWDGEAGLFTLAYVRQFEGRQAVTVIINESLEDTEYRYLRVSSSYGG